MPASRCRIRRRRGRARRSACSRSSAAAYRPTARSRPRTAGSAAARAAGCRAAAAGGAAADARAAPGGPRAPRRPPPPPRPPRSCRRPSVEMPNPVTWSRSAQSTPAILRRRRDPVLPSRSERMTGVDPRSARQTRYWMAWLELQLQTCRYRDLPSAMLIPVLKVILLIVPHRVTVAVKPCESISRFVVSQSFCHYATMSIKKNIKLKI